MNELLQQGEREKERIKSASKKLFQLNWLNQMPFPFHEGNRQAWNFHSLQRVGYDRVFILSPPLH